MARHAHLLTCYSSEALALARPVAAMHGTTKLNNAARSFLNATTVSRIVSGKWHSPFFSRVTLLSIGIRVDRLHGLTVLGFNFALPAHEVKAIFHSIHGSKYRCHFGVLHSCYWKQYSLCTGRCFGKCTGIVFSSF